MTAVTELRSTIASPSGRVSRQKGVLLPLLYILTFVTLTIPKAGFKWAGIPITPGTILFLFTIFVWFMQALLGKCPAPAKYALPIIGTSFYFFVRILWAMMGGYEGIDYIFSLAVAPFATLVCISALRTHNDIDTVLRIFSISFWVICLYGLLQFILGVETTALPGVTVNYSDWQASPMFWYMDKNNVVGNWIKLISTYQNGNLFGVNLLLIFPFAFIRIGTKWKPLAVALFTLVGFFSLSRSVWMGMVLMGLISFLCIHPKKIRIQVTIAIKTFAVFIVCLGSWILFILSPQLQERLLQSTGGSAFEASGRTPELMELVSSSTSSLLGTLLGPLGVMDYSGSGYEITLAAVYQCSGLVGVLVLVILTIRFLLLFLRARHLQVCSAALLSVSIYFITSLIEGAYWLPPTSVVMWLVIGVGLSGLQTIPPLDSDSLPHSSLKGLR